MERRGDHEVCFSARGRISITESTLQSIHGRRPRESGGQVAGHTGENSTSARTPLFFAVCRRSVYCPLLFRLCVHWITGGAFAPQNFQPPRLNYVQTLPSAVAREQQNKKRFATETDPLLGAGNTVSVPSDAPATVPPLRDLLTRPVFIALLNYGLLAFCDMSYESLLPLV